MRDAIGAITLKALTIAKSSLIFYNAIQYANTQTSIIPNKVDKCQAIFKEIL